MNILEQGRVQGAGRDGHNREEAGHVKRVPAGAARVAGAVHGCSGGFGADGDVAGRNAGLGRTTVSNALNRPVAPKARTIAEIARVLKLNPVELQQLRRQAEGTDTPQATSHAARKSLAGESASAQAGRQGLLVGALPLRASAFQSRPELRERIDAVRMGGGVVLTQARPASAQVLSGMGGVGKSQLATQYAHQAVAEGTGLVLWVPASEAQQIVTIYSQAALRVGAAGATGEDPEYDARALLEWLATTSSSCSWSWTTSVTPSLSAHGGHRYGRGWGGHWQQPDCTIRG